MRIMRRLLAERKGLFAGNLGVRLVKDLLPFQGPILVGMAVDLLSGSSGRDRNLLGISLTQNSVRSIVIVAIFMGLLAVAKTVIGYIHTIVAAHMGRHVVQAARRDLANATMRMSLDELRRFNSGDLLDRCLADSKGLRGFTQDVIIRVISNTVRAVYPLTFMFMIDPVLAVVVLAVIPLQSGFSAILQRRLQRQTREARAREASHTSAVKEAIDGWNNVASVGGQEWAAQGIHDTAIASEDAKIVKKRTTASISAVITMCTAIGIAAVYAIGGWRIIDSGALDGTGDVAAGALTLGTLTAFVGVAKKTYAPFQAYTKIVSKYRTGLVNLERIAEVLDATMIDPRSDGPELKVSDGTITLSDVSFSYNEADTPTLSDLNGSILGKSLTVITGSSGAGKTTLLRLLLGLDVPTTGSVSIDGQDINKATYVSLQAAISLVPQEPVLFSGSLSENLLLGLEDCSTQQVLDACERSGLLDMVRELPKGLDTEVGSGRHMLSGGQLRRMAIARALLREPAVLLLDEPTTGLDVENSMRVLATLRQISTHTTVVMVSHRSEPLNASDHHLILSGGGWKKSLNHAAAVAHDPSGRTALDIDNDDLSDAEIAALAAATNGTDEAAATNGSAPATDAAPDNDAAPASDSELGTPTNGAALRNGAVPTSGTSGTNGANGTAPHQPAPTPAAKTNGRSSSAKSTPDLGPRRPDWGHKLLDQRLLSLSAMGRPIHLNGISSHQAQRRIMLLSGHRTALRPVKAIAPAVYAQIGVDPNANVALASIEDINPDGAFSAQRETVLGTEIEFDHRSRKALETRALHQAINDWQTDLVIDIGERPARGHFPVDVDICIRFRPSSDGRAPNEIGQLGRQIRERLELSPFKYRVMLMASEVGSLATEFAVPSVELTAEHASDPHTVQALIEATVATYRSAATLGRQAASVGA